MVDEISQQRKNDKPNPTRPWHFRQFCQPGMNILCVLRDLCVPVVPPVDVIEGTLCVAIATCLCFIGVHKTGQEGLVLIVSVGQLGGVHEEGGCLGNGPWNGKWLSLSLNTKTVFLQRFLTLNVREPSYLGLTRSISWLLMPWLLTSPGHQQPWYWLCRICRSWSYLRKGFKYLCHINVE